MFEMLAAPVPDVPEVFLEGQFINGLKPKIRVELRVLQPRGLDWIMVLAQSIEVKNVALYGCSKVIGPSKGGYHYTPSTVTQSASMPSRILLTTLRSQQHLSGPRTPASSSGSAPFKRLSETEWKAKREKGLCFCCDEKYTISHRCKNRELQVLMVHNEEMEDEGIDDERIPKDEGEYEPGGEVVELSMNSVVGLTTPQTTKLRGDIKGHPVVVLIDRGATHNFIATKLVQQLGLTRTEMAGYGVIMGTGVVVQGASICKGVKLTLQNLQIIEDFLPLELGSSDVILGMK